MLTTEDFRDFVSGRQRGLWASCLRGLMRVTSGLYGMGVAIRNWQYNTGRKQVHRVEVPVISVGNLTLGGTGKTPMVAWIAKWFRQKDIRVTLISRGYGAERGAQNDEGKELEQRLPDVPHIQNPDRVEAAQVAVEELAAQVLLLDDAFQHRRIGRDLDIVLIDATEPFGYGYIFPRGTLREPLKSLARADVLVLTRGDMVDAEVREQIWETLRKHNSEAIGVEMHHRPAILRAADGQTAPLAELVGKPVLAFCGIGNPEGFRHSIESSGIQIADFRAFSDHHNYQQPDIEQLTQWTTEHPAATALVCTHKDLVKVGVNQLGETPLWALEIEATLTTGQANLEAKLAALAEKIPPDEDW